AFAVVASGVFVLAQLEGDPRHAIERVGPRSAVADLVDLAEALLEQSSGLLIIAGVIVGERQVVAGGGDSPLEIDPLADFERLGITATGRLEIFVGDVVDTAQQVDGPSDLHRIVEPAGDISASLRQGAGPLVGT